ncbi:hypothetical protein ACFOOM_07220 [Streptomyces echinoruber]|uniref:Uncharacterized protein n=1 Tax=Streptomyces echinoruber TaxID=68898 RepID=A0A918V8L6_9ACTN|nr:hypothetical protein [Streptomyces echinoruber]GGZ79806.1 hypothetical protein GCM10010389_16830 [Streptomyces echinoruber]
MTYNFFTVDRLQPPRIADALISCLHVEQGAVDVADTDGDQENRNWDALVTCDYSYVDGDVSLALDIYVQEAVTPQPPEPETASAFAAAARTIVLYPAEENIPSAYWLVTPTGLVTRARLMASDDETPEYSIDAVEVAVPQLPRARVMQLPEIVREQYVPTPATKEFVLALAALREARTATPINRSVMKQELLCVMPESSLRSGKEWCASWSRTGSLLGATQQNCTARRYGHGITSRDCRRTYRKPRPTS